MNVSGILVVTKPAAMAATVAALSDLPGVDVHHTDPGTGRIIVTQEGRSVGEEVEGLKRIKALPDVILAEMVHHHFGEDRQLIERPAVVPPRLDD